MKNKTAKQIIVSYRIKCALLIAAYVLGVAFFAWVASVKFLLGIACLVVLAASIKAPFDKVLESDIESVIYEDLDPVKFNELLAFGVLKKSLRHKVLGALGAGDYERVLELVEESEKKVNGPIEICNNLYRKGAVYFERGEYDKLPEIVKKFEKLKKDNPKIAYVFNNFSVFDKFDAFADEDYEYVIGVCDIDLAEISPKKQNHKLTKLNVSFYRAVSLYKLERFDEARAAFEEIVAFAPKMHKAQLSREFLDKMK